MKPTLPPSAAGPMAKQPPEQADDLLADKLPPSPRSAAKRQLKDYPQSLQTAARALWG